MDTMAAYAMAVGSRGARVRVLDWDEAARRIVAAKATHAAAGLGRDWEWTGGPILAEGLPIPREDTYTYLASTWAVPELAVGDHDGVWENAAEPCWRYKDETPGWDSGTYWPESALAILREGGLVIEGEVVMREIEA